MATALSNSEKMEIVESLSALSHPHRLRIFRLLVRRYPDAVPSGEIARALDLPANSCSVYLSALKQAGLVRSLREGTTVRYEIDRAAIAEFTSELFGECCRGRPDLCPEFGAQPNEPSSDSRPFNVLFICTGNSARSIMAEALLKALGKGRFNAFSAGTRPRDGVNRTALGFLATKGYDICGLESKSLARFTGPEAPKMDFVFTVCDRAANEECAAWPGHPLTAHWGLADPAQVTGGEAERQLAFQQAFDVLHNRISAFTALPIETLDRLTIQTEIDRLASLETAAT
jgi:protein-tyrosine-phosphatase/DNA-binding transcriptional ArsR family regulator